MISPLKSKKESELVHEVLLPTSKGGGMTTTVILGDLICCLYDEFSKLYGDDELAALAADVELNDLLVRSHVYYLYMPDELLDSECHS